LGALLQAEENLLISLVATGLIAVLFQPMRERVQQWVNRLFYGRRDDPLGALSLLGRRLEAAIDPEIVLSTLVETISQTLKLPYVAISLRSGEDFRIAAESGTEVRKALRIPLNYQGETVGQLLAGPRGPDESFSRADRQLLGNIAHQAGPAAYAVQLTEALRRSRVRLVTAREEERRRLRRDLHDGLGPVLASQGLKMAAVGQLLQEDPAQAQRFLEELVAQNETTMAEIRRLVYELRPAALDDLGLVEAVRDYAAGLEEGAWNSPHLHVNVQSPDGGHLPCPRRQKWSPIASPRKR
jgi:signal transduction histidine kinase